MENKNIPLCVDLDGTLIRSDLLLESLLALIKSQPWLILVIPLWLFRGRAYLKHQIAERVDIDPQSLPYQSGLVEFLKKEHAEGRSIVLATASYQKYADRVANHLGIFKAVHATNVDQNLAGKNKRDHLVKCYGEKGFDYAGNSRTDRYVWSMSRQAIVVNPARGAFQDAADRCEIAHTFKDKRPTLKTYLKELRVHQWLKNVLVFIPMLGAHQISSLSTWVEGGLAFIAFSLCASSVYMLNDLLDLPADRLHPRKRKRPFASGELPIAQGMFLIPLLLVCAFAIAILWLPLEFLLVLISYYLLTLSYSFWLKAIVLLDAVLLAGLYTVRIIGGVAATRVALSFWLLAFSIFLFFSLALVKRYSELLTLKRSGKLTTHGRGYHVEDLVMLMGFGVASGFMAVLVSALYINSDKVRILYQHPAFLWLVSPILLYWISRIWLITHRGGMHDDPVVFAAKDKGSWAVAIIVGGLLWLAAI
ncbi:UbiA family prenyltransferase [Acidithiobacillus albertensis]|uniref:UbiA family prenyltransferase n=1 Tax=Acidithiobacillus albertensis TaxID=119978 RepID=UPI001C079CA4|nr:UbiA family prenyltransferase [Acidithiobacillus albertensis]MBU2741632.1 UbiA family prenyltransferase [Acidithiobacillus albertensis]